MWSLRHDPLCYLVRSLKTGTGYVLCCWEIVPWGRSWRDEGEGGGEANVHSLVKIVGLWDDRYTMSL